MKIYNVQNFKCLRRDPSQNVKEDCLIDKGHLSVTFQERGEQSFCLSLDGSSWKRDGDRSQTSQRNNTQTKGWNLQSKGRKGTKRKNEVTWKRAFEWAQSFSKRIRNV